MSRTQSLSALNVSPAVAGDTPIHPCDREPIHIPGSIQPHGMLLVLDEQLNIVQASQNTAVLLPEPASKLIGMPISSLMDDAMTTRLREAIAADTIERKPLYIGVATAGGGSFNAIAHRNEGVTILELEPVGAVRNTTFYNLYELMRDFVTSLQNAPAAREIAELAAGEIRRITGFDRALVYQFDEQWNGVVIGESIAEDAYAPYMGLRFPATDIPRQARELYRLNRLRLIVDAAYVPSPILPAANPTTGKPLDLSFAALRSVSPVHVEYLKNMNAMASMSVSIMRDGELWGLVACHHRKALVVPFDVRMACDFIGMVTSVQLEARERSRESDHRVALKLKQDRLLAAMSASNNYVVGVLSRAGDLLDFADASGAAVISPGRVTLIGSTPSEARVLRLVDWLAANVTDDLFCIERLADRFPDAENYSTQASGLLAISISKLHKSYFLWFRPEVKQTVNWAGDPRKPAGYDAGQEKLHPRKSFEIWREVVGGKSAPWRKSELDAAAELRGAIVGIVLRKAEELAELNAALEETNKELEAFSYSVSHDLRAPFRHIVGYSELLKDSLGATVSPNSGRYIDTIIDSARFAGTLVDNLLLFSQMGRSALHPTVVDMNTIVDETRRDVAADEAKGRAIEWAVGHLPAVTADMIMLRLVLRNLLSNAVKYTRNAERPRIELLFEPGSDLPDGSREAIFCVRDNGVGFDMTYVNKLFGVFQRLHRMEEFEGTGIGLANVRRIITRHGGRVWAEGAINLGASFYFTLPLAKSTPAVSPPPNGDNRS